MSDKILLNKTQDTSKIFVLIDCNSFFCSCERLFRPDLKNKPVGVLSNNDGCFVSRTQELKRLGVPMGAPYFQYKDVCIKNKVVLFSSNFSLYTNISNRVMRVLKGFSTDIEVYSVDEAFLDLSGFVPTRDFPNLESYGRHIKSTVEKFTGIPVGIGIGSTKTLAKLANFAAKEYPQFRGVVNLMDLELREKLLERIEVDEVWGIGRVLAPKLRLLGIKNVKDLRDYPYEKKLLNSFSKVEAFRQKELQGVSLFHLQNDFRIKKQIMCSRSFGKAVTTLDELKAAVSHHAASATEKLRKQNSVCSVVRVSIRTNRFAEETQYYGSDEIVLDAATADTQKIIHAAMLILKKIYRPGLKYKKAGVTLSFLGSVTKQQLSLFEKQDDVKSLSLMNTIDTLNKKLGSGTIKFAVSNRYQRQWRMKNEMKSPSYVTGWAELPKVK